jgi:hypothetical protein
MAGFSTPGGGAAAGITKLSELIIDANKDWNGKSISNMKQIATGDVVFANNWRLTEVESGIALIDDKGKIIRRWENG